MLEVVHWLLLNSALCIELSLWSNGANLALHQPAKWISVSRYQRTRVVAPFALLVHFACTVTMQNHVFSVMGPRVWNGLPWELGLSFKPGTDTFCSHLKITIFV